MQKDNELTPVELGQLIVGMRDAYAKGENAMAFARAALAEYAGGGISALQHLLLMIYKLVPMSMASETILNSMKLGVNSWRILLNQCCRPMARYLKWV